MSVLLTVIAFFVILGPLIIIHELGHFIACRIVGVTVLEFGLGIPPRALKLFERNGTEFTLNWLPVGGFVRPLGEDFVKPVGAEATEREKERYALYQAELAALGKKTSKIKAMMEAGPWQRMFFLVAGSAFNFIGGFIILVIVATLGLPPAISWTSPRSAGDQAKIQQGDVILEMNGKQVKTADEVSQILEQSRGQEVTMLIQRDDAQIPVKLNLTSEVTQTEGVLIGAVTPDSPADGVFQVEDLIVEVDGKKLWKVPDLQEYIRSRANEKITFVVYRKGENKTLEATPRADSSGRVLVGISLIPLQFENVAGLAILDRAVAVPLNEAIGVGARRFGDIMRQLVLFPVDLIRGALPIQDARPVSAVGIATIGAEMTTQSLRDRSAFWVLNFAALISLALGFTNLLPIPGLDGGRILFVVIELLRGKPMNPEREGAIHLVGLMILLGLFLILVINDIVNPIGPILR